MTTLFARAIAAAWLASWAIIRAYTTNDCKLSWPCPVRLPVNVVTARPGVTCANSWRMRQTWVEVPTVFGKPAQERVVGGTAVVAVTVRVAALLETEPAALVTVTVNVAPLSLA